MDVIGFKQSGSLTHAFGNIKYDLEHYRTGIKHVCC